MDSMAHAASAVVRHSTMVIGAAADELARQDGGVGFLQLFHLGIKIAKTYMNMLLYMYMRLFK